MGVNSGSYSCQNPKLSLTAYCSEKASSIKYSLSVCAGANLHLSAGALLAPFCRCNAPFFFGLQEAFFQWSSSLLLTGSCFSSSQCSRHGIFVIAEEVDMAVSTEIVKDEQLGPSEVVKTEVEKADVQVKPEGMSWPDLPKSAVLLGVAGLGRCKSKHL